METFKHGDLSTGVRPVLTQTEKNMTLWIGHLDSDPTDHFGGQTFGCPSEGQLDNIQLFAASVPAPGEVSLTLHEFDEVSKNWGPAIGESTLVVNKDDRGKWLRFRLPSLHMKKSVTYGFRVRTNNAMVGLGEAACANQHPFTFGHEWSGDSMNQRGNYYSYFSLAFKVELRA